MSEINLRLLGYIKTLEREHSELKKISEDATKVEGSMRQYHEAVGAMKSLSDETEENYDKILKTVHSKESRLHLEEKLRELEQKYKDQCALLKEKEDLVKYYHDENVRKREATTKKTKKVQERK